MAGLNTLGDKASVRGIIGADTIPGADKDEKLKTLKSKKSALVACDMNNVLAYYGDLTNAIDKEAMLEFIAHNFSRKKFKAECDPAKISALDPADQEVIKDIFLERVHYFEETLPDLEATYGKIIAGVLGVELTKIPEEVIKGIIDKNRTLLEEIYDLKQYIATKPADAAAKQAELDTKIKTLKGDMLTELGNVKHGIHGVITGAKPEPLDFGEPLDPHIKRRSTNITTTGIFDWLKKSVNSFFSRGRLRETAAYLDKTKNDPEQGLLLLYGLVSYKALNFVRPNKATEGIFFTRWLIAGSKNRDKFKQECMDKLTERFNKIAPSEEEKPLLEAVKARFNTILEAYEKKMQTQYTA